jgi:hypothetical protein
MWPPYTYLSFYIIALQVLKFFNFLNLLLQKDVDLLKKVREARGYFERANAAALYQQIK